MIQGNRPFKTGNHFKSGDILLSINSDEYKAGLIAQKSNFFTMLSGIMADLQLDYPTYYTPWKSYLESIDLDKKLPELPDIENDKLKYFLSAKNILSTYHQVKNMEVRLEKYTIRTPYNGILTESNLNPGTLIRNGQKLGELIQPGIFEIELSIPSSLSTYLKIGQNVELINKDYQTSYYGDLRINGKVESSSQMLKVFVQIKDNNLKEGMYLEAKVQGRNETEVVEISRSLLVGDHSIYTVKNNRLVLTDIAPVHTTEKTVLVKGLSDGDRILSRVLPGATNGMEVKTINN